MPVAQLNIARLLAPIDSPQLEGFVAELEPINAMADAAPGFLVGQDSLLQELAATLADESKEEPDLLTQSVQAGDLASRIGRRGVGEDRAGAIDEVASEVHHSAVTIGGEHQVLYDRRHILDFDIICGASLAEIVILDDGARMNLVPRFPGQGSQGVSRAVIVGSARVGHGQHGDIQGDEVGWVLMHVILSSVFSRRIRRYPGEAP